MDKIEKEKQKLAEHIGERVVEKRLAKDWTRRDLARESGVNEDVLLKIEHGHRLPMVETLFVLARALGTQPGSFFPEVK